MRSSHVTTEPLSNKLNCKAAILLRMIDNCRQLFGLFGKKFNKSLTIRKTFITIKQLIELNQALNQIMK